MIFALVFPNPEPNKSFQVKIQVRSSDKNVSIPFAEKTKVCFNNNFVVL